MLDKLIKHEESLQMSSRRGDVVDPYNCSDHLSSRGLRGSQGHLNSSRLNPLEIGEARDSLAPGQGNIAAQETLVIGKWSSSLSSRHFSRLF